MSARDAIREALVSHAIECTGLGEVSCRCHNPAGWLTWKAYFDHVADAVTAAVIIDDRRSGRVGGVAERAVLDAAARRVLECADDETAAEEEALALYNSPRQGGKTIAYERLRAAQNARKVAVRAWRGAAPTAPQADAATERCVGSDQYVAIDDPSKRVDRADCPACGKRVSFHRITGRFARHNAATEAAPTAEETT